MPPPSKKDSSKELFTESEVLDRYEVQKSGEGSDKAFSVIDKHQADALIGTYSTFKQASIECTFLCLLHLKSLRKTRG
jgi:hypothetical protein